MDLSEIGESLRWNSEIGIILVSKNQDISGVRDRQDGAQDLPG